MNKTITNTFDISGSFKTGAIEHQLLVGADVSREDRSPKLGNYSSGTGVPPTMVLLTLTIQQTNIIRYQAQNVSQ